MKKVFVVLMIAAFCTPLAAPLFAQEFTVDGEVKTGVLWNRFEDGIYEEEDTVGLGSKDDAGSGQGRFRINMAYTNPEGDMGFKMRLNWENWTRTNPRVPDFSYAFGFGNFFDNQFTVSAGILGASPWGTGGPEMWKELDVSNGGGMRFEWKPAFVPGELNFGFILNYFNSPREAGGAIDLTLIEILKESVIGISYTNDYFHVRFAYRLDSEYDQRIRNVTEEGDELVYRIEERVLNNYLPDFRIWALGYYAGVGSPHSECVDFTNWIFAEYAPELFTAQLRFGMDVVENRYIMHFRPNFYWNFLNKFIVVGAAFLYGQDFGEGKVHEGSPFYYIEVEPTVRVNFTSNAYAAFSYNWRRQYVREVKAYTDLNKEPIQQNQWMNLMVGMTF